MHGGKTEKPEPTAEEANLAVAGALPMQRHPSPHQHPKLLRRRKAKSKPGESFQLGRSDHHQFQPEQPGQEDEAEGARQHLGPGQAGLLTRQGVHGVHQR